MNLGKAERLRLVHTHRYQEALEAFEEARRTEPKFEEGYLEWIAKLNLCLERLDDALVAFIKANDGMSKRLRGAAQPFAGFIGAVQWMLGHKDDAIETLSRLVDGLARGKITYSDTSHGAPSGLLLWYFGVSRPEDEARKKALIFLSNLSKSWPLDEFWPGPVALCILERASFEDLPSIVANDMSDVVNEGARDRGMRERLSHFYFYEATNKRALGDERGCLELMQKCREVENPIHEEEWYLARHEVQHSR